MPTRFDRVECDILNADFLAISRNEVGAALHAGFIAIAILEFKEVTS